MSKVFDSSPTSQTVSITGLKSRAELNGEKGVVLEHLSNERLKVRLNGSAIVISVKPENVILVDIEETVEARVIIHSRAINTNLRVWPNKTFFYPCKCTTESRLHFDTCRFHVHWIYPDKYFVSDDVVGNTPAKLLIKQVPVHQSVANVLLLGCGDPRHILFTSWCIQQAGGLSEQQILSHRAIHNSQEYHPLSAHPRCQ